MDDTNRGFNLAYRILSTYYLYFQFWETRAGCFSCINNGASRVSTVDVEYEIQHGYSRISNRVY